MRQVDRTSVPVPARLLNLTDLNRQHLTNPRNISSNVYGHTDVKQSLQLLYYDKCYICEGDLSSGGYAVEHYLPKEKFPHLGYTWSNLHKVCDDCNNAKERKTFFIKDNNGNIIDINLLDPASPDYRVSEYLTFDISGIAITVSTGAVPLIQTKANNTILYLNGGYDSAYGRNLPFFRSRKNTKFLHFCIARFNDTFKARFRVIKLSIDTYTPPVDSIDLELDQSICQSLINADDEYLADNAPFSTSIRIQLIHILSINYIQFSQVKEKMKHALGL